MNVPMAQTKQLCLRDDHTVSSEELLPPVTSSIQERDIPPLPLIKESTPPAPVMIEEVTPTIGSPDLQICISVSAREKDKVEEGETSDLNNSAVPVREKNHLTSVSVAKKVVSVPMNFSIGDDLENIICRGSVQQLPTQSMHHHVVEEEDLPPITVKEDEKEPLAMVGAPNMKTTKDEGYCIITSPTEKKEDDSSQSSIYTPEERKKWVSERVDKLVRSNSIQWFTF